MHPDHRPESMIQFQDALMGNWNPDVRPRAPLPAPSFADVISSGRERSLIWASAALVILSLIATLSH